MSPEAQRVAIAEACGWKLFYSKHNHWIVDGPDGSHHSPGFGEWEPFDSETGNRNEPFPKWYRCDFLPDYLNDLNAMHEAEKRLTKEQQERYAQNLYFVLDIDWLRGDEGQLMECKPGEYIGYIELPPSETFNWLIHAPAAQRAEAFLRTIGKWTND